MRRSSDYEVDEGNVFSAIGRKDAKELVARSELLDDVGNLIEKSGLTQHEVAKKLSLKRCIHITSAGWAFLKSLGIRELRQED